MSYPPPGYPRMGDGPPWMRNGYGDRDRKVQSTDFDIMQEFAEIAIPEGRVGRVVGAIGDDENAVVKLTIETWRSTKDLPSYFDFTEPGANPGRSRFTALRVYLVATDGNLEREATYIATVRVLDELFHVYQDGVPLDFHKGLREEADARAAQAKAANQAFGRMGDSARAAGNAMHEFIEAEARARSGQGHRLPPDGEPNQPAEPPNVDDGIEWDPLGPILDPNKLVGKTFTFDFEGGGMSSQLRDILFGPRNPITPDPEEENKA